MTVLCRRCGKDKAFEEFWWELRSDRAEGTAQIVQFQYYWIDRDAQFCSRKCLLDNLEDYCQRAEERVHASPTTEAHLAVKPREKEKQSPAAIAPRGEEQYEMIMNEIASWMGEVAEGRALV